MRGAAVVRGLGELDRPRHDPGRDPVRPRGVGRPDRAGGGVARRSGLLLPGLAAASAHAASRVAFSLGWSGCCACPRDGAPAVAHTAPCRRRDRGRGPARRAARRPGTGRDGRGAPPGAGARHPHVRAGRGRGRRVPAAHPGAHPPGARAGVHGRGARRTCWCCGCPVCSTPPRDRRRGGPRGLLRGGTGVVEVPAPSPGPAREDRGVRPARQRRRPARGRRLRPGRSGTPRLVRRSPRAGDPP